MTTHPVLIAGEWRASRAAGSFTAFNPALGETLESPARACATRGAEEIGRGPHADAFSRRMSAPSAASFASSRS